MFDESHAVRSDYYTDDAFIADLRKAAASDLPLRERLDLVTAKLRVTRREDKHRPVYCALNPFIPKRWRSAACRWGLCG